jgi:hypothetical protein
MTELMTNNLHTFLLIELLSRSDEMRDSRMVKWSYHHNEEQSVGSNPVGAVLE